MRAATHPASPSEYDRTRRADPFITSRLLHHLRHAPSGRYVELGCGTGNYTQAMARAGGWWVGADVSWPMVEAARAKEADVEWCVADVRALALRTASFDGAVCSLALHYFKDLVIAFAEARRVLARGRLVLFTATPEQMRGYWLNEYFPKTMERATAGMPTLSTVNQALVGASFRVLLVEPYEVRADLQDYFLYSGKHDPARYLDGRVRAGMSAFSVHGNEEEIERGCRRLAADVASGRAASVAARYRSALGDYIFVVAEAN
ncbi:MAG: class I SAM-dependent methyltransferase [Gemmatimonadaceae bacterium]